MTQANWAGILLTIVIFFALVGFISSKIIIYDGSVIEQISSVSLFDMLTSPIIDFFEAILP